MKIQEAGWVGKFKWEKISNSEKEHTGKQYLGNAVVKTCVNLGLDLIWHLGEG